MKWMLIRFSILVFCCTFAHSTFSQVSPFNYRKFTDVKGDTLLYRFLESDYNPSRKYPLVIFLHGSGERGSDNEAQLKWGAMNFATTENMKLHPAFVIAPQCPLDDEWANFASEDGKPSMALQPNPSKPIALLMELMKEVIKNFPIDTNRIYITGLSMGGFGTFDLIERYPDVFAAAVPVCGGGDVTKATAIKHIPIWIFHGAEDAGVDPTLSLAMVNALVKAGAHPGYTQYPEVGHFSWIAAYSDPMMMAWLFRQRKE